MTPFKNLLVWAELSVLLFWTQLQLPLFGYQQQAPNLSWIPALNETQRLIAVRRLKWWRPNCLAWSIIARAYLLHCGEQCEIRFSAALPGGHLQAHAFLKFTDGSTIGERATLVELI